MSLWSRSSFSRSLSWGLDWSWEWPGQRLKRERERGREFSFNLPWLRSVLSSRFQQRRRRKIRRLLLRGRWFIIFFFQFVFVQLSQKRRVLEFNSLSILVCFSKNKQTKREKWPVNKCAVGICVLLCSAWSKKKTTKQKIYKSMKLNKKWEGVLLQFVLSCLYSRVD